LSETVSGEQRMVSSAAPRALGRIAEPGCAAAYFRNQYNRNEDNPEKR
jgi:hypothetical protein